MGYDFRWSLDKRKGIRLKTLTFILTVLLTATVAVGQQSSAADASAAKPKTKLEAFERQTGSVIIRGFSTIGTIIGIHGGSASVEAREFVNPSIGKREYGIVVEVKEGGRLEREDRSYVDYDEIEPLLHGIDYVLKVDASTTKLSDFQADYHTKGDLTITTFSSASDVKAAITSGRIGGADVIITVDDLQKFRKLVATAKARLDDLRKSAS